MTHVFRSVIIVLAVVTSAAAAENTLDRDVGQKSPPVIAGAPKAVSPEAKKPEAKADQDHDKPADKDGDHDADGGKPIVIPAAALSSLGIAVGPIERRTLIDPIHAAGTVIGDPDAQAMVTATMPGVIRTIKTQIGDTVKAGQVLAEIASPEFVRIQNEFILKSASLAGVHAALQTAKLASERARTLTDGGVSVAEQQRREGEVHQAEAALAMVTAECAAAAVTLRLHGLDQATLDALPRQGAQALYPLVAPIDGLVMDRDATVGAQVGADGKAIFLIADPARLWVVADVPELRFGTASLGSAAVVTSLTGERLGEGDVSFVYPGLDQRTRTGRVRIALGSTAGLHAGQYVQAAIIPLEAEGGAQVIAVPEEAVVRIDGKHVVFVAEQKGGSWSFSAHPIIVGSPVGGFVPVATGLDTDEHIVVHGAVLLKAEAGKSSGDND